jgi:hypothetical protein
MSSWDCCFCTARRRNGLASVHDLLTGTRVIRRMSYQARPVVGGQAWKRRLPRKPNPWFGPYHVLETLERTAGANGCWVMTRGCCAKVDSDRTRRHRAGAGELAQSGAGGPAALDCGPPRAGRKLGCVRMRATGQPLLSLANEPQPWSQVRFWLLGPRPGISKPRRKTARCQPSSRWSESGSPPRDPPSCWITRRRDIARGGSRGQCRRRATSAD